MEFDIPIEQQWAFLVEICELLRDYADPEYQKSIWLGINRPPGMVGSYTEEYYMLNDVSFWDVLECAERDGTLPAEVLEKLKSFEVVLMQYDDSLGQREFTLEDLQSKEWQEVVQRARIAHDALQALLEARPRTTRPEA